MLHSPPPSLRGCCMPGYAVWRRIFCFWRFRLLAVVLLLFFITPAHAAQGDCTLSYGGLVSRQSAVSIAKGVALSAAVTEAAASLSHTAARYGVDTFSQRAALALAIHRPAVTVHPSTKPEPPAGDITVRVRLETSPRTLDARLREALQHPEALELREMLVAEVARASREGEKLMRAAARARQKRGLSADDTYEERIEFLGKRLEALGIFDTALLQLRDVWKAPVATERLVRQALSLDSGYAPLWCALGELQLQQDQPQAALESLNKALKTQPDMARALYVRGLGHLRLQQPALAETDFTAALRLRPDTPAWLRARGAARMVREEYGSMCEDFIRACALGDCEGLAAARKRSLCLFSQPPADEKAGTPPASPPAASQPDTTTP